ncbi:hypothetical protein CSUI_007396, partial [Cystoisospora suis]
MTATVVYPRHQGENDSRLSSSCSSPSGKVCMEILWGQTSEEIKWRRDPYTDAEFEEIYRIYRDEAEEDT